MSYTRLCVCVFMSSPPAMIDNCAHRIGEERDPN